MINLEKRYGGVIRRWEKCYNPEDGTLGYYILGFFDLRHGAAGATSNIICEKLTPLGVMVETTTSVFYLDTRPNMTGWTPQSEDGVVIEQRSPLVRVA